MTLETNENNYDKYIYMYMCVYVEKEGKKEGLEQLINSHHPINHLLCSILRVILLSYLPDCVHCI